LPLLIKTCKDAMIAYDMTFTQNDIKTLSCWSIFSFFCIRN